MPRTGTSPVEVADWWASLADWQREVLIQEDPTLLGNLDGLPARVRDRANRASIAIYRARLSAEVDEFDAMVAFAENSRQPVLQIPDSSKNGGDALASFFTGINASRGDRPPHLTALGHSYGWLTTAYALRHKNTGVDDGVVFGSPGLGITDIGRLKLPAGHLSEAEATDDRLVADSGAFGSDPSDLFGIRKLRTDAADTPLGHTGTAHGHGGYLKEGTTSQYNIAAIVAGLSPAYQLRVPTILDPGAPPDAMFGPIDGDPG